MIDQNLGAALDGRTLWVTGARGFLGARLVELAGEHARIVCFPGDVRDEDAVRSSLLAAQPDVVLHLAAPVNVARDPALNDLMQAVIVAGSRHVRRAAQVVARSKPVRVVQVGTCEEYGTIPAPFAESDAPSEPVSPYAAAKLAATREALAEDGPAQIVVARPFLTYGPGQRPRQLIPALIDAALSGRDFPMTAGTQTREVNYVDDTVLGLLRAATVAEPPALVNIGGGEELTVLALAQRVVELAGAPDILKPGAQPIRSGEVPRFCCDPTLAQERLGHVPTVSLDEGLARTIAARRG